MKTIKNYRDYKQALESNESKDYHLCCMNARVFFEKKYNCVYLTSYCTSVVMIDYKLKQLKIDCCRYSVSTTRQIRRFFEIIDRLDIYYQWLKYKGNDKYLYFKI